VKPSRKEEAVRRVWLLEFRKIGERKWHVDLGCSPELTERDGEAFVKSLHEVEEIHEFRVREYIPAPPPKRARGRKRRP
jgi:hypothetical protein